MDMTYQEKSTLGSLVITIVLFGYYFAEVFNVVVSGSSEAARVLPEVIVGVVVAVIVVEIAYHILISLGSKAEERDERDVLIGAKAARIAYFVLAVGCVTTAGQIMLEPQFTDSWHQSVIELPYMAANFIVISFILAEIVGFAMQLYYYRRGV